MNETSSAAGVDDSTTLLMTEYGRSSEFCNHVDNVRNVITSFFLTVVGGAAFAIDRYTSGQVKAGPLGSPAARLSYLLGGVAITGLLFIMTIARLRRIQTERYQMMNAILDVVLTPAHRTIVSFRDSQIPGTNAARGAISGRLSGSYIWTVILMLPTAATAAISAYLGLSAGLPNQPGLRDTAGPIVGLVAIVVSDRLFWILSRF